MFWNHCVPCLLMRVCVCGGGDARCKGRFFVCLFLCCLFFYFFFITTLVWKLLLPVALLETVLVCGLLQGVELIPWKLALGVLVVLCMNLSWGNPQLNLGRLHHVLSVTPLWENPETVKPVGAHHHEWNSCLQCSYWSNCFLSARCDQEAWHNTEVRTASQEVEAWTSEFNVVCL